MPLAATDSGARSAGAADAVVGAESFEGWPGREVPQVDGDQAEAERLLDDPALQGRDLPPTLAKEIGQLRAKAQQATLAKRQAVVNPANTAFSVKRLMGRGFEELIGSGELAPEKVRQAIEVTFARRKTHNFSDNLNPPPDQWQPVFKQLAGACGINDDIEKTFDLLKHYVAGLKIRLRQTADPAKAD